MEYHQRDLQSLNQLHKMLECQLNLVYPLEEKILLKHQDFLSQSFQTDSISILDVGTGTGGFVERLTKTFPNAALIHGVELLEKNIKFASERVQLKNVKFSVGNAFDLKDIPDESYHLVTCRHMIHCVSKPLDILDQIKRVLKPGGIIHVIAEDYGLMYGSPHVESISTLFGKCVVKYFEDDGTDGLIGRKIVRYLDEKFVNTKMEYLNLDTTGDKKGLWKIFETWRDGYSKVVSEANGVDTSEMWNDTLSSIESGYFSWLIPTAYAVKK